MGSRKLRRELRAAGAADWEVAELMRAADSLSELHVPGMSATARRRVAARLPIDIAVEPKKSMNLSLLSMRRSAIGAFAAVVIVAGAVLLPAARHQDPVQDGQKSHQVTEPKQDEQQIDRQLEQRAEELKQLQQQPTVDPEAIEKTKDEFQRDYKRYERSRERNRNQDNDSQNRWNNYQSQWWWQQNTSSKPKDSNSSWGQQQNWQRNTHSPDRW